MVIQSFWKCLQYNRLIMKLKEIINKLEEIEGSLDDAFYSLPEYNANSDSRSYIDSARNELYVLKEEVVEVLAELNTEEDTNN